MNVDLQHTTSAAILTALTDARHRSGTAALGMVLTLVVDVNEIDHHDALRAALAAAREHPCRIVTVIRRAASAPPRLDAEIRVGEDNSLAEVIVLRMYGDLRDQADSMVLPLLLPDAPVLVWWPGQAPAVPSQSPLGLLAQRRVTDAAASRTPLAVLRSRSDAHAPGDTDFAWTRLTPWRTLLAAALDQPFDPIVSAEVSAARNNPSAELLATWLEMQLRVPVARTITRGPGLTGVALTTKRGHITISRPDGRLATLERTGQPDRSVALPRRGTDELLAEELRRLDPDDIYNETIRRVFGAHPTPPEAEDDTATRQSTTQQPTTQQPTTRQSTTARAMRRKPPMPPSKGAPASVTAGPAKPPAKKAPAKKAAAKKTPDKKTPGNKAGATKNGSAT
ncbi:MAG TPA: glucose-6-phosphate dehydrogenase assembly protein OpcA [Acidothermaceae bacterium]